MDSLLSCCFDSLSPTQWQWMGEHIPPHHSVWAQVQFHWTRGGVPKDKLELVMNALPTSHRLVRAMAFKLWQQEMCRSLGILNRWQRLHLLRPRGVAYHDTSRLIIMQCKTCGINYTFPQNLFESGDCDICKDNPDLWGVRALQA